VEWWTTQTSTNHETTTVPESFFETIGYQSGVPLPKPAMPDDAPIVTPNTPIDTDNPQPCDGAHMIGVAHQSDSAMGHTRLDIVLINATDVSCTLTGYPTLSGLTTDGVETPLDAAHGT
jgi:Protein of unknown function (DUF4232)